MERDLYCNLPFRAALDRKLRKFQSVNIPNTFYLLKVSFCEEVCKEFEHFTVRNKSVFKAFQNERREVLSYLGEPNSSSFIETRHTKLYKVVCIYAVFSHT